MPMPVSVTFSRRSPCSSRSAETKIRPPSGVNLIAFDSKLLRICCTFAWSCRSGGRLAERVAIEVDVFLLRQRPGHVALRGNQRADLELAQPDLHLAAFHLGQVQDVVDHLQQHAAGALNVADVALLLVVERVDAAQHVAEAQNAVERRAQLVAHRGQEVALEPVHLVELHVGLGQLVEPVVQLVVDVPQLALLAQSCRNMRLNAAASSSNSSPVRITARCSTSPSRTALATSRRCVTGLTITYRTTAHSENIERKPTTMAAAHKIGPVLDQRVDGFLVVDRHADDRHQVAFLQLWIRRRAQ